MNFIRRIFRNLRIFPSFTASSYGMDNMDAEDNYLYYSNSKLQKLISNVGNKDKAVEEYLRTVKYAPISDFEKGLEWFNVSEPLSFEKHLKGKVVVLDFFTYCCINCMHIIPDLREIENEFSVEDGLVVIGVHSAKFENEKISANILAAVQRYNIGHPVVNDYKSDMWQKCDVHCWPTLLMLGPNSNPIVMLTGEGHKEDLRLYIRNALEYYKEKKLISNHKLPFKSAYHLLPDLKGPLLFPGKITNFIDNSNEILAISDTGNNRILVLKSDGTILHEIGGRKLGFKDGTLEDAEFNNPQGLAFQNRDVLFVADTENHAIRRIDLKKKVVETVAGTGVQGHDREGGNIGKKQVISSPWDVCIYQTPDMDLTFYADGNPPIRDIVIIAMAGTHQIWALFLEDTVWWKCKKYAAGTCVNIAGSGREENRNNSYPHAAAFAQPSGLALCSKNKEVYIADSESSCIRRLSLIDGKVTPVVGGDRNPNNLFAFGDKDGALYDAKLQHSLGVAVSPDETTLFVADTYNHKLKKVDISQNSVSTLKYESKDSTDGNTSIFKEPAGVCVSSVDKQLYLADTNNHVIKLITLGDNSSIIKIEHLDLKPISKETLKSKPSECVNTKPVVINSKGGKIALKLEVGFKNGLGLTTDAPQRWFVDLPNPTWSCVPKSGVSVKDLEFILSVPKCGDSKGKFVDVIFNLITCSGDICLPKNFSIRIPVNFSNNGATSVSNNINVIINVDSVITEN